MYSQLPSTYRYVGRQKTSKPCAAIVYYVAQGNIVTRYKIKEILGARYVVMPK